MNAIITCLLKPGAAGTNFTYLVGYEIPRGILGRVLARSLKGSGEREVERSLANVKSIVEE